MKSITKNTAMVNIMKPEVQQLTQRNICGEWLDTMTRWMYAWWGEKEGYSQDAVKAYMQHGIQEKRFPQTYGLFLCDELIGMYQLRLDDLFVRPDVYPWLANVFIDEVHRGKGYGRILMESIGQNAKLNMNFNEIFLYTKHVGLYEKYGWEFISEIDTYLEGERIQRLYRISLK